MTYEDVVNECHRFGEEEVIEGPEWNGFKTYVFFTDHGQVVYDGPPVVFLVDKDGNGRYANSDEQDEVLDLIAEKELGEGLK